MEASSSQVTPENLPHNPWEDKLKDLASLKDGWNGYSAPRPEAIAISNALRFLTAMRIQRFEPTRVAASAIGGVGITWRVGSRKAFAEFFNDGSAHALFADDDSHEMDTAKVETTRNGFLVLIDKMREYLHG